MKSRRNFLRAGVGSAALATLAGGQALAAAGTALFRNQLAHEMNALTKIRGECPLVELRQYTLQPDSRERFIALFEREFIESQEELGMTVIGQFRDLDDANRFVWLRGFADLPARAKQLTAFYLAPAPAWKAHREEANSMIVDSDNVLLLRAPKPAAQFGLGRLQRAAPGSTHAPGGMLVATIYHPDAPADAEFVGFFETHVRPALQASGIEVSAYFASETAANNFPKLPVREHEPVFVWFALYPDEHAYQQHAAALNATPRWRDRVAVELRQRLQTVPQILRLTPTPRSLLHA
jgi:hypothetical protein